MELFRKNQKVIFWIITILVIVAFIGMDYIFGSRYYRGDGGGGGYVAEINGKRVDYAEYSKFRQRLMAAMGETPFQVAGAMQNDALPGLWDYLWAMFLVAEGEKAGVGASDALVGTYLRNAHPIIAERYKEDPSKLDEAVNSVCLRNQISRSEFLRGVKEWMIINNYVELDNATLVSTAGSAYSLYALERSEFDFKRIRVEATDTIREQAKKDVMEKPADDLNVEVREFIAASAADPRYREPAKWRFAYVLVPFTAEAETRAPTEEEIQAQYDTYKSINYDDKPLDEVREAVTADLARQERERLTLRNLTVDVDQQLREHGGMAVEELAKLTPLLKNDVKTGDTGADLRTAVELASSGVLAPMPTLVDMLTLLDQIPPEMRDGEVDNWKSAYLLTTSPMRNDQGYVRLKLLDYQPSVPVEIGGAGEKIDSELLETALADMIDRRVRELTRERADEIERQIGDLMEARRAGGEGDPETGELFDQLPVESKSYREIATAADLEFGRMGIGEVRGPVAVSAAPGVADAGAWDILVLTERRVPNQAAFEAEPVTVKRDYADRVRSSGMGRIGFSFAGGGLVRTVQPSEAMRVAFWDKIGRREIVVNPELLGVQGS